MGLNTENRVCIGQTGGITAFYFKARRPVDAFLSQSKLRLGYIRTHLSLLIFVPKVHCCRCCAPQPLPRMPVSGVTADFSGQSMNDSTDKSIENPMKEIHVTQHKISSETVTKTGSSGFDLHYCSRQRLTRITSTFQHGLQNGLCCGVLKGDVINKSALLLRTICLNRERMGNSSSAAFKFKKLFREQRIRTDMSIYGHGNKEPPQQPTLLHQTRQLLSVGLIHLISLFFSAIKSKTKVYLRCGCI